MARLEEEITLLTQAGCKVILVSFGTPQGCMTWLAKYGYQLDMFCDQDRMLYTMLGQARHCWANIATVKYATVMEIEGRVMPALVQGDVQDDLQMGGNITVRSADRKVVMAYAQAGVTDRPSVNQILEKIAGFD